MSFTADQLQRHRTEAEAAWRAQDPTRAFFHARKAAAFGLKLAEQSQGKIARRHLEVAFDLIDFATELKAQAHTSVAPRGTPWLKETSGDLEEDLRSPWQLAAKPEERLADVAGLQDVKEVLQEKVVIPFQRPDVYARFRARAGAGVLMYGPPGNGKTFIARAIAGELDAAFYPVNASQIKDKYVGETEKNLQRLFDDARQHPRAVVFIDEAEHLLSKRGNRKLGVVAQFLTLADGLVRNPNCLLLLAATNKPWNLDEAVIRPGRLGTHIYVGPPDLAARTAILTYHLRGVPQAHDVGGEALAAPTEGYSGADLAEVCDRAKMLAIRRQLAAETPQEVTRADFMAALSRVRPSLTTAQIRQYDEWRNGRADPDPGQDLVED